MKSDITQIDNTVEVLERWLAGQNAWQPTFYREEHFAE
jgi:hypothetical protein